MAASASESYELIEGLPAGHKEQHPAEWIAAVRAGVKAALDKSGVDRASVRGIGVSGQQHGFVALDENDRVIRAAKLWCDTATSPECEEIIAALGGLDKTIEAVGNGVPAGFTASKILWMKKREPEKPARLRSVLLPHDYINFWLTGRKTMECGDASGTALLDVGANGRRRRSARLIRASSKCYRLSSLPTRLRERCDLNLPPNSAWATAWSSVRAAATI